MINIADIPNNTNASWWKDPGMRKGMFHIIVLYCAVYSLGYDGSLLNGLQALPMWQSDFGYPKGTRLGLIAATYYLPKILAVFFLAWMMDKYGRKACLYFGAAFMIAGALLGTFAKDIGMLCGSRVLIGLGTVAGQMAAVTMVPEIAHPRIRHFAGGYLLTTFYIGSIIASWVTFACVYFPGSSSWSWRIPTLGQALGPVILGAGTWFIPESPRWLFKYGRIEEAHKILATYHANGDMNDVLVLHEMKEIKAAIEIEKVSNSASWGSFFGSAANRRRIGAIVLVGAATQLAGNGVVQYYLVPVLKTVGISRPEQTAGINGGLAIFNWFVSMFGASMVEKLGRRKLFLTSGIGMFCSFVLILGIAGGYDATKNTKLGVSMVPFIFVFMGFYSFGLTPLPMLYTPEIVPLALRAKAFTILAVTQNTSNTFNQFVNPVALAAIGWKYYAVYVGLLAFFTTCFYFFLRETRSLTVEQSAMVYESDERKEAAIEAERALRAQIEQADDEEEANEKEKGDIELKEKV